VQLLRHYNACPPVTASCSHSLVRRSWFWVKHRHRRVGHHAQCITRSQLLRSAFQHCHLHASDSKHPFRSKLHTAGRVLGVNLCPITTQRPSCAEEATAARRPSALPTMRFSLAMLQLSAIATNVSAAKRAQMTSGTRTSAVAHQPCAIRRPSSVLLTLARGMRTCAKYQV
jgi:hypothetical protein